MTKKSGATLVEKIRRMDRFTLVSCLSMLTVACALSAPIIYDAVVLRWSNLTGWTLSKSSVALLSLASITNIVAEAIKDKQNADVGVGEKALGGDEQLEQAEITYEAMRITSENAIVNAGMSLDACDTLENERDAADAKVSAHAWAKTLTIADSPSTVGANNTGTAMRRTLDTHNLLYCSDDDERLRRCVSPGNGLQNADIQASTLLSPNAGATLSDEEFDAGREFVKNITNGIPVQDLPASLEKTQAGQAYILEQRKNAAQISMSQYALNRILAAQRVRN